MFELIENKEIQIILDEFDEINSKKVDYSFNLFSLSTYGDYLENFHSDIIAKLLDVDGEHGEGDLFLKTFLEFLNKKHAGINLDKFNNVSVYRERGRIDIAIIDKSSNEVIIFENKINNATDMNEQLERYYSWCSLNNYKVSGIVYMTLTGSKKAPQLPEKYKIPAINLDAFSNSNMDLVNGWIIPCIGLCKTFDTASLLKQYSKLIINLGFEEMNNEIYDKFFELADDMNMLKDIDKLKELSNHIPQYRMDKFVGKLVDFRPFTKSHRYKPNHMLYERFKEEDNLFKLDIWFEESGNAQIHFWNPEKEGKEMLESLKGKLMEINYLNKFEESSDGFIGFYKRFEFVKFHSLKKMDEYLYAFVKEFISELNKTSTKA